MLAGIFSFVSFRNRKSTTRRRHSGGRRLRGIELLERREMMSATPVQLIWHTTSSSAAPTSGYIAALEEAFAQFDKNL